MAVTVEANNHQAWYKVRYGQKNDALPDNSKIQESIPFRQKAKTGRSYVEPVLLRSSHGVTIKGGAVRGTVYAYNAPQSPVMDEVEISGCEITLRDQIAVGAVAAAMGNDTSYGPIVDEQVMELMRSHRNYVEWLMLYGQSSVGTVLTSTVSGANRVVAFTLATWAPGIWSRGEGMRLDAVATLGGVLKNTNAPYDVIAVDFINRTITLSGNAADLAALAPNDLLVFRDADGTNGSFTGIDRVVTNTGALHGIDAAVFSLWRGNVKAVANVPLTMGVIHGATVDAVDRGLESDITWLVPTKSWQNLCDNESALRRYAEAQGREYKTGANKLTFLGANGAEMNVVPHRCVKWGEAFGITPDEWVRGGESELVDTLPGTPKDQFFHNIPGFAGLEILNYSSQFLFCRKPSRQVKITGILPSGA
jgi:hypothetical protein